MFNYMSNSKYIRSQVIVFHSSFLPFCQLFLLLTFSTISLVNSLSWLRAACSNRALSWLLSISERRYDCGLYLLSYCSLTKWTMCANPVSPELLYLWVFNRLLKLNIIYKEIKLQAQHPRSHFIRTSILIPHLIILIWDKSKVTF